MTEKIMQCCYTNAVKELSGKISSGWQAVAVSDDLPPEAYSTCVNLQNANSTIPSHMVDEQGSVLDLFEIIGDGGYVYVIRTQYGLTDRLGRPNMFSHAYIFSWKQGDIIRDPNVFVTLTRDNFAKDEESARRPKDALKRSEPFTLESALERAGMTEETYLTLIQCVYAQYSEKKSVKPVCVQYDGTQEQMQAILYCVYCGLPYCVRRNLSIASAEAGAMRNRNLIFSAEAARHDCFVIPQTGENSILTPRIRRKIARYGFVEHAALHYKELDVDNYFQQLERLAMELGDSTASEELALKIAHQQLEGSALSELTEEELNSRLSDALRSKLHGSQKMDHYISSLLDAACRRRLPLTEESEANLAQRLALPVSGELADAGEQYNIFRLSTLSTEAAAKMLHGLSEPVFCRYRQTLLKNGEGLEILDLFYAVYGLENRERTWDALNALLNEIEDIPGAVRARDCVDLAAWDLYHEQLEEPGAVRSAYCALMDLMRRLHGNARLDECGVAAKEIYWDGKTLQTFSREKIDEYRIMQADAENCRLYLHFYAVLDTLEAQGGDAFLQAVNCFAVEYQSVFGAEYSFLDKLKEELSTDPHQAALLSGWMEAAALPEAGTAMQDILTLRGQLYRGELSEAIDTYQEIAGCCSVHGNTLVKLLGKNVVAECQKVDRPDHWIPIDIWLALGRTLYPGNSFRIFDELEPCVLYLEDPGAAEQSKLLGKYPFTQQAEAYIQGKGKTAKTVQKWINERKSAGRRRKADERRARWDAGGVGRGLSFLSQLTSGEESSKSGPRSSGQRTPQEDVDFGPRQGFDAPGEAPEKKRQNEKQAAEKRAREKKRRFPW